MLFAICAICVAPSLAQEQFGQITGLITDSAGATVPEAKVDAVNESTGVIKSTTTNAQGSYFITSLIPGTYRIVASRPGFKSITRTGITLDVSQVARVDVVLEVGDISQQVTVNGAGATLQTDTASVGTVIAESAVTDLPLNGRNYLQLAILTPGVVVYNTLGASTNGFLYNTIQAGGLRNSTTAYAIDGADVTNQKAVGTSFTPAPDAIAEFKIDTNNMSVRNGTGGAAVNVVLKSGTNAYHGDVYEFWRNNDLNARNFFALTSPELRQNQFGATLGGPILKNRTFFFADYQGTRVINGMTQNSVVPTAAQKAGNFAGSAQIRDAVTGQPIPNNQIPASAISPQTAFFLPFMPLPNSAGGTYVTSAPATSDSDQFDVRVDEQIRSSDSLSVSYSFLNRRDFSPGPFPQVGALTSPTRSQLAVASWTHTFGPATVNQARLSYTHFAGKDTQQGLGTNYTTEAGIGGFSLTSTAFPGFPVLNVSGFAGLNGNNQFPYAHKLHNWNFDDELTVVRGKHTFDFGGDARSWEDTNINASASRGVFSFTGAYTGNAFADYMYGVPFSGTRAFPLSLFGVFQRNQDVFAQDTWRISRRFTLIGGIRYDLIHPFTAVNNTFAAVNLAQDKIVVASNAQGQIDTTAQLSTLYILPIYQSRIVPSSQLGLPRSLVYTNTHDFAPRLGAAYDPGHGIAVRGGYGIFHLLDFSNGVPAVSQNNSAPFLASETPNNTTPVPTKTIATFFPPLSPGTLSLLPAAFAEFSPNLPTPYSQQWNLSVQKVVHRVISLQAAYVGNKGTHLLLSVPTNVPNPGPGAIQANRPNTFWAQGALASDTGNSSYNALQTTAEVRAWHGFYVLGSYVWGKSLDTESTDGPTASSMQDPNNVNGERAISSFNIASRFTFASTYEIPFFRTGSALVRNVLGGWSISNIIIVQSGPPFTPTISTDPANTGTPERPNRIGSGIRPNPTISRWFDAAAFTVPSAYTYGNSARDILTGPGLRDWDVSLFKDFKLRWRERMKVQFRGEMYNFTNTPPFGLPQTNIQTPATVGRVLTAGAARSAQLVLKVLF
jgi:hypothetical protein